MPFLSDAKVIAKKPGHLPLLVPELPVIVVQRERDECEKSRIHAFYFSIIIIINIVLYMHTFIGIYFLKVRMTFCVEYVFVS